MIQPPRGIAEIKRVYGDIKIERDPIQGGWRIYHPIAWERVHMTILRDLPGLPGRKLYVHKLIAEPLQEALRLSHEAAPDYRILSIGCFNPRPKRSDAGTLSLHSWGAAVDINPAANPMRVYRDGETIKCDMPDAFVKAWESVGWTWGGRWRPRADPMHWQYASGY